MGDAPILDPVNLVEDYEAADDFTKKHTPYLEFCGDEATMAICVTVGKDVPHPNEPGHFIDWIELYADDAPIARFDFAPVASEPRVSVVVNVELGKTLRAVEHCNLHGLWAMEERI